MTFRLIGFLLIAAVFASAQIPAQRRRDSAPTTPQNKCKLEGRVISAATGEPLKKATLRLRTTGQQNAGPDQPAMSNYTASTDAQGKFVFDEIDAVAYSLSPDA